MLPFLVTKVADLINYELLYSLNDGTIISQKKVSHFIRKQVESSIIMKMLYCHED